MRLSSLFNFDFNDHCLVYLSLVSFPNSTSDRVQSATQRRLVTKLIEKEHVILIAFHTFPAIGMSYVRSKRGSF